MTTRSLDSFRYDICVSFAGEDRPYVEAVAAKLKKRGARVFYDRYEEVELWGKDLYEHLDHIYKNAARFCVMFISKHYASKLWTTHERKSAQERAFKENAEYILPARFDDTPIPGLRDTVGYVDLRDRSPDTFAELILKKLERTRLANSISPNTATPSVTTHRDLELGYEISYLRNWIPKKSPTNSALFLKRQAEAQLASISVNVANFTGDKEKFFEELKASPTKLTEKYQERFPDAELLEHGDTSLGSFPAYYFINYYSISNLDISVDFVVFQVFCIRAERIYLVNCEIWAKDFEEVFAECRAMLATFNFR